jgi:hypothetical protein
MNVVFSTVLVQVQRAALKGLPFHEFAAFASRMNCRSTTRSGSRRMPRPTRYSTQGADLTSDRFQLPALSAFASCAPPSALHCRIRGGLRQPSRPIQLLFGRCASASIYQHFHHSIFTHARSTLAGPPPRHPGRVPKAHSRGMGRIFNGTSRTGRQNRNPCTAPFTGDLMRWPILTCVAACLLCPTVNIARSNPAGDKITDY